MPALPAVHLWSVGRLEWEAAPRSWVPLQLLLYAVEGSTPLASSALKLELLESRPLTVLKLTADMAQVGRWWTGFGCEVLSNLQSLSHQSVPSSPSPLPLSVCVYVVDTNPSGYASSYATENKF